MKFSHMSDCHIGGWKEDTLREINIKSFEKAIQISIEEKVDFIIIAGDLFDVALPSIESLKRTTKILNNLKTKNIPVYIIPGSHDFSASGKTMLDVLENAELVTNVMKLKENKLEFTTDKTGTKITGYYGKKGGLEHKEYETLEKIHLEKEEGTKIFLFHSLINEIKPTHFEKIEGISIENLPKGFNYYAGGHPHYVYLQQHPNYGSIAYPGPIFPNNFQELETLKHGGFHLIEIKENKLEHKHIKLPIKDVVTININSDDKTPQEIEKEILNQLTNIKDKIITIRIEGCLKSGKTSDINFKLLQETLSEAYYILKNTNKLTTKEFQEIGIDTRNVNDIEATIIEEHAKQSKYDKEIITNLSNSLDKEKGEGEKSSDFENRIIKEVTTLLNL